MTKRGSDLPDSELPTAASPAFDAPALDKPATGPPLAGPRVLERGRSKAYRPLPPAVRASALAAGLAAYRRGDFFEAHELLEPAWMGASDPVERSLYQGLIKLAAAYVHQVRGNPLGMRKNLRGARERLADATRMTPEPGSNPANRANQADRPNRAERPNRADQADPPTGASIDLVKLLGDLDERLAALDRMPRGRADAPDRLERRRTAKQLGKEMPPPRL